MIDRDTLKRMLVNFVTEVYYTLEDCETVLEPGCDEVAHISPEHRDKLCQMLDEFSGLPFEQEGYILGPASKVELALDALDES